MKNTLYSRSEYLASIRQEKIRIRTVQVVSVALLLAVWELAAQTGVLDAFIVSSPVRMVKMFLQMVRGDLAVHILYTVGETLPGIFLGAFTGFVVGAAPGVSPFLNKGWRLPYP